MKRSLLIPSILLLLIAVVPKSSAEEYRSTLNYALNPEVTEKAFVGDVLTLADCRKIVKEIPNLIYLQFGQNLDGACVEPGGLEALLQARHLVSLNLELSNLEEHRLDLRAESTSLAELTIGSGPYVMDRTGKPQPAVESNFKPLLTERLISQLEKMVNLKILTLRAYGDTMTLPICRRLADCVHLEELNITCAGSAVTEAEILAILNNSRIKRISLLNGDREAKFTTRR